MISRPVALTRAVLVTVLVWGAGAGITVAVFRLAGASTTISVHGTSRSQIIWWGSHAFCACVGALLGVCLGGTALTKAYVADPLPAALSVSAPVLVLGTGAVVVLDAAGVVGSGLAAANLLGLLIGIVAGIVYVIGAGVPDELDSPYGTPRRASRSWGSR